MILPDRWTARGVAKLSGLTTYWMLGLIRTPREAAMP